jgi:hypothetical protein
MKYKIKRLQRKIKEFYYVHFIERFTGKIFSGYYDYQNKPFFAGDKYIQEIFYRNEWFKVGNIEVVEKICHPSKGVQETSLSLTGGIPFWWTCKHKSDVGRLVKIET